MRVSHRAMRQQAGLSLVELMIDSGRGFALTAAPSFTDTDWAILTLDSQGRTGPGAECW